MRDVLARSVFLTATLAATLVAAPAFAGSMFQQTCSDISFAYEGNDAAIQAVCLRADGTPNKTSLKLMGIGNDNGKLVKSSGPATFQHSCGNIGLTFTPTDAKLNAFCRTSSGASQPASIELDNISNQNGELKQ